MLRHFLLLCVILQTSQGFMTMQQSSPSSRSSNLPFQSRSSKDLPTRSQRTVNEAVATGGLDLVRNDSSSIRSRVGVVLGDLKSRIRKPSVEVVEDISDFQSVLRESKEQLVAVFFHSPVCKACQAAAPHFVKLSRKYSNVKFLSVPLTPKNKLDLQELGVKKFPFSHIYDSQRGLLDEAPMLRKKIPEFEERLLSHVIRNAKQEYTYAPELPEEKPTNDFQ